jgi:CMP-N-acetylneuraminic acid synthetase
MVKNIAIIPARSGSKRVKDKNIYPFNGKPLMAWTIETALNSGVFDKVMVSTDSEKYAQIAKNYGAWVPFLRDSVCDDFSTIGDVITYTLKQLKERLGLEFDNVASMQATCPLCTSQIVKDTYKDFVKNGSTTTITCFPFNFMNPWWAFKMDDGKADFILSSPQKSRSQDNPQLYCPTGMVSFSKININTEPVVKYHPVDWKYAVDIDNYEDIDFANVVFEFLHKGNNTK